MATKLSIFLVIIFYLVTISLSEVTEADARGGRGGRGGRGNSNGKGSGSSGPSGPTTTGSGCSTSHRHRKSWKEISQTERDLYLSGFRKLADRGITQQYTQCHYKSALHQTAEFLPWHRHFIYEFESSIRSLGGEYECFTLPYWDWTEEPTPSDVRNYGEELFIMNSGLGPDSNGECVAGFNGYTPNRGRCLIRDLDYDSSDSDCTFSSYPVIMNIIDYSNGNYAAFRPNLEGSPHALPHICLGGANGNMATMHSPDDPIFYLHHSWVDYIWSLWQDCNNYDGVTPSSYSNAYTGNVNNMMSFAPLTHFGDIAVKDTFDIINDYDVSWEKGAFWTNADVDGEDHCGTASDPVNSAWFYSESTPDSIIKTQHKNSFHRRSDDFAQEIWKSLKNAQKDRKKSVSEWARMVCEYEELQSGKSCEQPSGYYDDCSSMPIDPETNDIVITRKELEEGEGITECMLETRQRWYKWASMMHELKYLCAGCYDPFCNKDLLKGKCEDDVLRYMNKEENSNILSINSTQNFVNNNGVYLIGITLVVIGLIFIIKMCLYGKNTDNKTESLLQSNGVSYGSNYKINV